MQQIIGQSSNFPSTFQDKYLKPTLLNLSTLLWQRNKVVALYFNTLFFVFFMHYIKEKQNNLRSHQTSIKS